MASLNFSSYALNPIRDPQFISEDDLVAAAQGGHEWAFMELCNRHCSRVMRSIYRVTKNREDAEDALQDCMLRAFLHLKQFDRRANYSTWFTRIGINSALMILRKKPKLTHVSLDDSFHSDGTYRQIEIADRAANPEESFATSERRAHLGKAVSRLPRLLRTVIDVNYRGDGSVKDTADRLGISVPAAKSRLVRARNRLRRSMAE